jgi:hypothetical protein
LEVKNLIPSGARRRANILTTMPTVVFETQYSALLIEDAKALTDKIILIVKGN